MKECDIQKSCVSWFRNTYPEYVMFSVPPTRGILKGDTCVVADGGTDKSPTWLR